MVAVQRMLMFALAALASCNSIVGFTDLEKVASKPKVDAGDDDDDDATAVPDGGGTDSSLPLTKCDPAKPFDAAVGVEGQVNSAGFETSASLTNDELTIVFQRTVGLDGGNLMMATRASRTEPFANLREMTELSTSGVSYDPTIRGDGLVIFWAELVDGNSHMNVFTGRRTIPSGAFTEKRSFDEVNSTSDDNSPFITASGSELWLTSDRTGQPKLYRSLATQDGAFGAPVLTNVLSIPSVRFSSDLLTVYFASTQAGGSGKADIWFASRPTVSGTFGPPINAGLANGPEDDAPSWISPDNCRLYLMSTRNGLDDIFVATRTP